MTKPKTAAQKQATQAARAAQTADHSEEFLVLICGCCTSTHMAGARYVRSLKAGCPHCGQHMELRRVGDALQDAFSRWAGRAARMDATRQGLG